MLGNCFLLLYISRNNCQIYFFFFFLKKEKTKTRKRSVIDANWLVFHCWPQVWELYKSGRLAEAIDPCLNSDYPAREAMDVLQIGLLCTQALASSRPSMAAIVKLLTSEGEREVDIPKQPPFLNPCGPSRRSCRITSLVSHAVSKLEGSSCTSTTDSGSSSNLPSRSGDFADLNSNWTFNLFFFFFFQKMKYIILEIVHSEWAASALDFIYNLCFSKTKNEKQETRETLPNKSLFSTI